MLDPAAREAWDSVLTKDAMTCLRKFFYLHVEGWRRRNLSVDLFFGQVYATAHENYHKLLSHGIDKDLALIEIVRLILETTWIDGKPWDSLGHVKNRETLVRTFVWYVDQFKDDAMKVVELADGSPAVELSFQYELAPDVYYSGHIDRLVEYSGDFFVQDQKTSKHTLTQKYFEQWHHPEPQMTGYTFAGQIITSAPVKGVIIDAAQIAVGFSRFERGFTFRTPAQLDEWRTTVLYHIGLARRGDFPMNPNACDKYGGCMFRPVCSRDPSVREQFLKADFEKGPLWNPEEKR